MKADEAHSASRLVHFFDVRTPHELRCALERQHLMCFNASLNRGRLEFHANGKHNGLPIIFRLLFTAADLPSNAYSLFIQLSWSGTKPDAHDYFLKSSQSWFEFWCRDLNLQPHAVEAEPNTCYQELADQALNAESQLTDTALIQQRILEALRNGAVFSTASKEGGARIGFSQGRFFRQDYGESEESEVFPDDASFLTFLRKFYDWEVSRALYPDKASDETAWRLIQHQHHR